MAVENFAEISALLGIALPTLILLIIWTALWKGLALWKAARKNHLVWFVALLIINTLGILEILYIFVFSKIKLETKFPRKKRR